MSIELHNVDCMEYMRGLPDNAFELAIVDPPYGIKRDGHRGVDKHGWKAHQFRGWDEARPITKYWDELRRVSYHQIVWGGNYFVQHLNPSSGWVYWHKGQQGLTMSDGEFAYTSFDRAARMVTINRCEIKTDGSIHPTQKPVKLYEWLLMNYAKEGDRILDTHLGSGSSAIAAHNCGFDFVGCELDTDYFNAASKRLKQHQAQLTIPID